MVGCNCALYGCPTSRTHEFAILKSMLLAQLILNKKRNAREEWLRIILRTREKTADLQKQIDENKTFLFERLKPECILTCKYFHFMHERCTCMIRSRIRYKQRGHIAHLYLHIYLSMSNIYLSVDPKRKIL
jgi:hypothetical protein